MRRDPISGEADDAYWEEFAHSQLHGGAAAGTICHSRNEGGALGADHQHFRVILLRRSSMPLPLPRRRWRAGHLRWRPELQAYRIHGQHDRPGAHQYGANPKIASDAAVAGRLLEAELYASWRALRYRPSLVAVPWLSPKKKKKKGAAIPGRPGGGAAGAVSSARPSRQLLDLAHLTTAPRYRLGYASYSVCVDSGGIFAADARVCNWHFFTVVARRCPMSRNSVTFAVPVRPPACLDDLHLPSTWVL